RYQCPADQSTLIRLDSAAELALQKRNEGEFAGRNSPPSAPAAPEQADSEHGNATAALHTASQQDLKTRLSHGNSGSGSSAAAAAAPAPDQAQVGSLSQVPIGLSENGLLTGFGERRSVVATIEWPTG